MYSLAQETSIRARIKSAEKRIIERVVFIEFWLVEFTILSQIEYPKYKRDPFSQRTQLSVKPASAALTSALNLSAFSCLTVRLLPDQDRSGLPRVRIAHNRELIHRSAGEKLRSALFLFLL
jgi:hypothetical protein